MTTLPGHFLNQLIKPLSVKQFKKSTSMAPTVRQVIGFNVSIDQVFEKNNKLMLLASHNHQDMIDNEFEFPNDHDKADSSMFERDSMDNL
jgi:hypothetical protein